MLRKAAVPKRICDRRRAQNADMGFSAFYLEKDGDNPQFCWNHGEYYLDLEYYEIDFGR